MRCPHVHKDYGDEDAKCEDCYDYKWLKTYTQEGNIMGTTYESEIINQWKTKQKTKKQKSQ